MRKKQQQFSSSSPAHDGPKSAGNRCFLVLRLLPVNFNESERRAIGRKSWSIYS
jgi:hypothetical protein